MNVPQIDNFARIATHQINTSVGSFDLRGYSYGKARKEVIALCTRNASFAGAVPLLRVQLSCLYGEVFHSCDCDCGQQIDRSLRLIGKKLGIFIYFPNTDARGLGLSAKLLLTAAEETTGCTPYEAARLTGKPFVDFNCFDVIPSLLADLGVKGPVKLVSNSPQKLAAITSRGIEVSDVVNLRIDARHLTVAARKELMEKRDLFQHIVLADHGRDRHDRLQEPSLESCSIPVDDHREE